MSQDDILRILSSNRGKWFSKREFKPLININNQSLIRAMQKVSHNKFIYGVDVKSKFVGRHHIRFLRKK